MTNERTTGAGISLAPGTKVGKYEIVEMLAVGGQAVVYKARDPLLDRLVAVKQISSTLAADPAFVERFRREAQILARLGADEPGIVTVHELIESSDGLFIVMEFLDGITIERSLEDNPGPVEVRAVLAILWRLAAAMNAVHKAGIIHRDLKPSNLVISEGLRVTITDFGVAASTTGQTSMLLGTTKYMAPELFTGQSVDARVDIYSLGLVIYEMLIGRAKFREIFADIVRDPHSESLRWMKWHGNLGVQAPPACEVNPNVPKGLSDLVVRMMAKKVEERFGSMEALGRTIKQNFGGRGRGPGGAAGAVVAEAMPGGRSVLDDPSALVARPVEGRPTLLAEPKETATAPLPKKKLPLRTKLIVVGVIFVAFLALTLTIALRGQGQQQRDLTEAAKIYAGAKINFDKEAYAPAAGQFAKIVAMPGKFRELDAWRAQAKIMETLCQGYLQVEKREWDAAAKYHEQVKNDLDAIQQEYKGLVDWSRDVKDADRGPLGKLERRNKASKAFSDRLEEARKQLAARQFERVRDLMSPEALGRSSINLGNVLDSLKIAADELYRKAEHELTGQAATSAVAEGDQLAQAKKYKEAVEAYKRAQEKVAATRGLTGEEQAALLKDIDAKIRQMTTEEDYQTRMAQADTAKQQGLSEQELAALLEAVKIRPASDALKARIVKLQRAIDRAGAELAVNDMARPTESKITAIEAFLAKYPDDDWAKTMQNGLKNEGSRREMVAKGAAALEARDWNKAIESFRQAIAIMPDKTLDEKVKECRYQLLMEKARAMFAEKKYEEALGQAEKARAESEAHLADVQAFQTEVSSVKNFDLLMQRAVDAFKAQSFGQAKDFLDRAKKAMPSRAGEADAMLKKVDYRQLVSQGDEAMTQELYPSAKFMYERAQKVEDTEEVRRKLEQVRAKLGGG